MTNLRIAVIGLGERGFGLLKGVILNMKDVDVVVVCDSYSERIDRVQNLAKKRGKIIPEGYSDYKEILALGKDKLDGIILATSWSSRIKIAIDVMKSGIAVATEVGGAKSVDECWDLVECYEETKTPYMLLENCCYGEIELAALNMKKQGVFGEIIQCEGGYKHDLRYEIAFGKKNKHYRINEYQERSCENYPTHEIGPIAKILDINCGNRFTRLLSTQTQAKGLKRYIDDRKEKYPELKEVENIKFKQADIVNTFIECENGEKVFIQLDTTLPRSYSRAFEIRGTKAMYQEDGEIYVNDYKNPKYEAHKKGKRAMLRKFRDPIWREFRRKGIIGGHGGMDYLVLKAFFNALRTKEKIMPIDVYDAAVWLSIAPLSQQSLENDSKYIDIPDFTRGRYKDRKYIEL